uniref:tRNA (guanine(46)-N(7))-methyltransferase n=1 Tax=Cucumis melo TaxID=3656 RepID=A0A9I9CNK1_CUCME
MASSLCLHLQTCSHLRCLAAAKPAAPSVVATANKILSKRPFLRNFSLPSGSSADLCERQPLRSSELVALEYADLNLSHKMVEDLGHVRIRQHVPTPAPNWDEVFRDPTLPLMVDIGSVRLSPIIPVGLVKRAGFWVKELGFSNVHFMFANATISFKQIISSYPGPLLLVSILCPDPHFKKRHHKRRVLQKPLVESIVDSLMPGGQVFIQSDVLEVAADMRLWFDSEVDILEHIDKIDKSVLCDKDGWLLNNPMGIRTEREIHAESEGANIYRRMYSKVHLTKEEIAN